jgi:hypothetical protein
MEHEMRKFLISVVAMACLTFAFVSQANPASATTHVHRTGTVLSGIGSCTVSIDFDYDGAGIIYNPSTFVTSNGAAHSLYHYMGLLTLGGVPTPFFTPAAYAILGSGVKSATVSAPGAWDAANSGNNSYNYMWCAHTTGGHEYVGVLNYDYSLRSWTTIVNDPA